MNRFSVSEKKQISPCSLMQERREAGEVNETTNFTYGFFRTPSA